MKQKMPQFYMRWIRDELGIQESSDFAYHKAKEYTYLIMNGPESSPGNLFIFVFLNPDKKRREPEFLQMHRIQASEVFVDNYENLLNTLRKVD